MDQYTRKTQRTRVFNPAPKAAVSLASTVLPKKSYPNLKRTFVQALDTKLEEYLARKKGKLHNTFLNTIKTNILDRKVTQSSTSKIKSDSAQGKDSENNLNCSAIAKQANSTHQKIPTGTLTIPSNQKVPHTKRKAKTCCGTRLLLIQHTEAMVMKTSINYHEKLSLSTLQIGYVQNSRRIRKS